MLTLFYLKFLACKTKWNSAECHPSCKFLIQTYRKEAHRAALKNEIEISKILLSFFKNLSDSVRTPNTLMYKIPALSAYESSHHNEFSIGHFFARLHREGLYVR